MAPGPERRVAEVHRQAPYARPLLPAATPSYQHGTPELDASAHAALRSAAAAAAKAAIGQQQRQAAVGGPPSAKPLVQVPGGPAIVKVSGESDPRKVAGKLAHTCREQVQPAPAVFTTGTKCINQAVKAICIARGYLADRRMELTFQTAFREGGTAERPSVALFLTKHPNSHWLPVEGATELAVSGSSVPTAVAAALAARCRENTAASLVGIGMDAVAAAVQAIGHTRLFLEPVGKDVRAWPEFIKVNKNGGELNAIKFHINVDQLR